MKQHLNVLRRDLALLLATALLGAALSGCAGSSASADPETARPEAAETETDTPIVDTALESGIAGSKEETVYVKTAPDGTVREVTVEGVLKDTGESPLISDYSTLTDLRNTEGDEEFIWQSNGIVLWENHGEDIYYKGTAAEPLPVTVRITYWLDGQEIPPEELAGRSGEVRIRFDYENHAVQTVNVNGEDVSVRVPFVAITAAMLSDDHFSNVTVTNGKTVSMDGEIVVIGYALPGLSDSLRLADYEPTEEIELPEYVELTADVESFELDFTATVITDGLLEDADLSDLDDVDDLIDDMDELEDAIDELVDGVDELYDGAKEFGSYLSEYTGGAKQLDEGAKALAAGLKTLNDSKNELMEGVEALQGGLDAVCTGDLETLLDRLDGTLGTVTLPDGTVIDSRGAASAISTLLDDEQALHGALSGIEETLGQWEDFADEAKGYVSAVQTAVSDAKSALEGISSDLTDKANEKARAQAVSAAESALAGTDLSDEEKSSIKAQISGGIDLSSVTDPVAQQIGLAESALEKLPALEIPQTSISDETVGQLVSDMQKQAGILQAYAGGLTGTAGELADLDELLTTLNGVMQTLDEGSRSLAEGAGALADGVQQLSAGAEALSQGTAAFRQAGSALNEGYDGLLDGIKALDEGVAEFGDEGVDGLTDLAGDDLRDVLRRVWALKEADGAYINFSGICDGQDGSVKFIIETDEIKP